MNKLEQEINQLIISTEKSLLKGELGVECLELGNKLAGYLSMCIGLIERLDTLEAKFKHDKKLEDGSKSNVALSSEWKTTEEGIRQIFWQNRVSRLKVLIERTNMIYYENREERKRTEVPY